LSVHPFGYLEVVGHVCLIIRQKDNDVAHKRGTQIGSQFSGASMAWVRELSTRSSSDILFFVKS
jgi:hypothetical protein